MAIVGEAHVVIRAIGDKLKDDIQKQLESASINAGKSGGDKGGKSLSDNMSKTIKKNSDDIFDPLVDSAEDAGVEAGRRGGRSFVETTRDTIRKSTPDLESLGDRIGNGIGNRMNNGFARSRFNRVVVGAAVKLSILTPIIGAIIGGLSTLISGLYAVVATLGTAFNSSVALLGVLGALGQGLVFGMIAFGGVGEALKYAFDPKQVKKFNEAMSKLSPEAQKFVKHIQGMRKGFLEIRKIAAENMFPGIVSGLKQLSKLMPEIRIGAEYAGKGIGDMFKNMSTKITSDLFKENLGDVFKNNAAVLSIFGDSLGNIIRLFVALLDAAGPLTERFSKWFEGWTDYLATSAEAGNQTGRLTAYFEKAGDAMALWGRITHNFVEGLYEIGKVGSKSGFELLGVFDQTTQKMADFTDSAENVEKLEKYFDDVKKNFISISGLIKELGGAFGRLGAEEGVRKTADALSGLMPTLEKALSSSIDTIGPKLVELADQLLELFIILEESNAISNVLSVFTAVAKGLNTILSIPGIGHLAKLIIGIAAAFKALSLVGKLGGFMFSPVIGGMKKFQGSAVGLKQSLDNINKASLFSGPMVGSLEDVSKRQRNYSAAIGQTKQEMGKLTKATSSYISQNKLAVRGVASMGLMMASTTTDSKALSSILMGTGIGAVLGPWGALAGAIAGVGFAAYDAKKSLSEIQKMSDKELGNMGIQNLQSSLDKLQGNTKWSETIREGGILGKSIEMLFPKIDAPDINPIGHLVDKVYMNPAKKEEKRIKQAMKDLALASKLDTEINTSISFEQSIDDVSNFVKTVNAEGKKLKFDIGTQIGRDLVTRLDNVARSAKELGDSASLTRASDKIQKIAKNAGASDTQAQLMAASLLNVDKSIKGIPDSKLVNISAEDKEFLRKAGVSEERIKQLSKGATARIAAKDDASPIAEKAKRSMDIPDKTAKIKITREGIDPQKLGSVISNIGGKTVKISIKAAWDGLSAKTKKILGVGRAEGGWVFGPGSGTSDSIPARLSNGEFVVRAKQAAKYGTMLEAINEGKALPKANLSSPNTRNSRDNNNSSGGLRIVAGELSLSPDGRAFISGIADDVYNGNDDFDRKISGKK